jgi:hypothetical protein
VAKLAQGRILLWEELVNSLEDSITSAIGVNFPTCRNAAFHLQLSVICPTSASFLSEQTLLLSTRVGLANRPVGWVPFFVSTFLLEQRLFSFALSVTASLSWES